MGTLTLKLDLWILEQRFRFSLIYKNVSPLKDNALGLGRSIPREYSTTTVKTPDLPAIYPKRSRYISTDFPL